MTHQEMLDYRTFFGDCDATTLREYFRALLITLWKDGEGFSGKRPFGNSGWDSDVYLALVEMGAVKGEILNDDGCRYLDSCDYDKANKLVPKLIAEMCGVGKGKK